MDRLRKRETAMENLSRLAQSIKPYVPGEQPRIADLIKLNTNENPYPPSPRVIEAVQRSANGALRLYPDPESHELRTAIAKRHRVVMDNVFVGNGSDEVLALAFLAFFDPDRAIRFADITYSFYKVYAALYGMKTDIVPLNADLSLPIERFYRSEGGVLFPNPNAPTGCGISLNNIAGICSNNDAAVVVDEAYAEFGITSAVELLGAHPNLAIVKTFSKSHSLAGLRLGYAIAHKDMIDALTRIKNSFNSYPVDRIAQAAAKAAIEDESYTQNVLKKIIETRGTTEERLKALGFVFPASSANFLFIHSERIAAAKLQRELRERAILVRRFDGSRIDDYLRVTVGTDDEMERLIYAVTDILGSIK